MILLTYLGNVLAYLHYLHEGFFPSENSGSVTSGSIFCFWRTMQLFWKRVRWHMQRGAVPTNPSRPRGWENLRSLAEEVALGESRLEDQEAHN